MKFQTGKEVLLGLLPFYHIYGMMVLQFATLTQGAKVIIHPKFEPDTFLQSVQDYGVRQTLYNFVNCSFKLDINLKLI